jgi:hypothetical protein
MSDTPFQCLTIYRYEDEETFWVAAPDVLLALAYLEQEMLDEVDLDCITAVPDGESLTITDEATFEKETKTAREWADGCSLICCVASTCW